MVRLVVKPNLRAASCCKVEVINGGAGLRLRCFFSSLETNKLPSAAASNVCCAACAVSSFSMLNWLSFSPL